MSFNSSNIYILTYKFQFSILKHFYSPYVTYDCTYRRRNKNSNKTEGNNMSDTEITFHSILLMVHPQ